MSDFSHAVFGVSTKRKSTYPGSGLYNAPEIRRRDAVITSDLLPFCETFSFGLLVWELLMDGESFFDRGWLSHLTSVCPSSPSTDSPRIRFLERLPRNSLLDKALAYLHSCTSLLPIPRSVFALVFEHSLKDHSSLRSDMSEIAAMLDVEDR